MQIKNDKLHLCMYIFNKDASIMSYSNMFFFALNQVDSTWIKLEPNSHTSKFLLKFSFNFMRFQ